MYTYCVLKCLYECTVTACTYMQCVNMFCVCVCVRTCVCVCVCVCVCACVCLCACASACVLNVVCSHLCYQKQHMQTVSMAVNLNMQKSTRVTNAVTVYIRKIKSIILE